MRQVYELAVRRVIRAFHHESDSHPHEKRDIPRRKLRATERCESHHRLADLFSNSGRSWLIAWLLGACTRERDSLLRDEKIAKRRSCESWTEILVKLLSTSMTENRVNRAYIKLILAIECDLVSAIKYYLCNYQQSVNFQ